jgi:hypothetical protein
MAPRWRATMPAAKVVQRSTTASTLVRTSASSASRLALDPIPNLLWQGPSGVGVTQIGSDDLRPYVVRAGQLVGQRLEPVFPSRHENQAVAAGAELARDMGADTRRRAGHQCSRVRIRRGERHVGTVGGMTTAVSKRPGMKITFRRTSLPGPSRTSSS